MQEWLDDVFRAPHIVGASYPDDTGHPDYFDPGSPSIANGVIVPPFTAWFPTYGRVSVTSAMHVYQGGTPNLNPPDYPVDYILSFDGTSPTANSAWHLEEVTVGYPPFATLTATPPRLLIARITCSNAGITDIYDIRARHPAPLNTHYIDLVALGADPTGVQDSTAAVQAALTMAAKGDSTNIIIVPPNSRFLIWGQLVVFGNNRGKRTADPRLTRTSRPSRPMAPSWSTTPTAGSMSGSMEPGARPSSATAACRGTGLGFGHSCRGDLRSPAAVPTPKGFLVPHPVRAQIAPT